MTLLAYRCNVCTRLHRAVGQARMIIMSFDTESLNQPPSGRKTLSLGLATRDLVTTWEMFKRVGMPIYSPLAGKR